MGERNVGGGTLSKLSENGGYAVYEKEAGEEMNEEEMRDTHKEDQDIEAINRECSPTTHQAHWAATRKCIHALTPCSGNFASGPSSGPKASTCALSFTHKFVKLDFM